MAQSQLIEPKDIRKGDTIKVSVQYNGVTRDATGVAHTQDSDGDWRTPEGGYIYIDMSDKRATVYLVERPQKPLPTFVYPRIIATKVDGTVGHWLLTLDSSGVWGTQDGERIRGQHWFAPDQIQEWSPFVASDLTPSWTGAPNASPSILDPFEE